MNREAGRSRVGRLFAALRERPGAEALVFSGRSYSYGELDLLSRRYAAGLSRLGIRRGDRVAVFCKTGPEVLVALLAHHRLGVVHVPINTRYHAEEAGHILEDSGAAAVLVRRESECSEVLRDLAGAATHRRTITIGEHDPRGGEASFEELLEADPVTDGPPVADEDTALLVYTSGTTGKSKGAALSYRAVTESVGALMGEWRFTGADRVALALPLFHVHGLCIGVHGALMHGAALLLFERFDAGAIARAFEEEGATVFLGVPTMYVRLIELGKRLPEAAQALSRARLFTSGSAALPESDFEAFERLTGHRILERYGMTETLFTLANPYAGERRPGTVGIPVPGCEVRVVDDEGREVSVDEPGEILVRSNGIMTEYWGRPEETKTAFRDGWFATGDLARRDPDGYVRILGRKSVDFIKSGGFKISAREIEDVLRDHPLVRDVAVVGAPDRVWGERVVAAVVLRPEAPPPGEAALLDELGAFCSRSLADYKRPREVRVFQELPRNAMGKVVKPKIVEMLKPSP